MSSLRRRTAFHTPGASSDGTARIEGAGEFGGSLIVVLAIIIFGSLVISGLLFYSHTQLRAARTYRERNAAVTRAEGAVDLTIARARGDLLQGRYGSPTATVTATYQDATASCTGRVGSGAPTGTGRADRVMDCTASAGGRQRLNVTVKILDGDGDEPGADVQILTRSVRA